MTSQTADIVESVAAKLQNLPGQQQQQVLDFVEFLAQKYAKPPSNQLRVAGLHKGMGWISDDFNDPIPPEYWGGKEGEAIAISVDALVSDRYPKPDLVQAVARPAANAGDL